MSQSLPVDEILERLGPIRQEKVLVHDREFLLLRPAASDSFSPGARLGASAPGEAIESEAYIPFWADLWPAARMLAKVLLTEVFPAGERALEMGCGLGLPGIVALSRGLHVVFSDYDPCALRFAADNARLNGFADFETLLLDWNAPPPGLQFPVLLGADLIYEVRHLEPLVDFIKKTLTPGGTCYLTDQERLPAATLRAELERCGMSYTTQIVRAGEPGGRRLKGTLYRIRA